MPRSLDPSSRITMVLASDVDKPRESQPRIFAKSPTLSQQRKLVGLLSSLGTGGIVEKFDLILDAAETCLTGWENIPVQFNREGIADVLSLEEIVEVISHLASASTASADDKKKSELPPLSGAVNSVNPASVDAVKS